MSDERELIELDGEGRPIEHMLAPPTHMVPVQRVQTKYTTAMAVQRPRVLATVEKKSLEEAALLGADAFYGWGNGKDRVEGPTVELAMALVRCFGNCAIDLGEVQDTADAWIFTATFVDLETGFTLSRQFRQSKRWVVHGKFDDARKDDIRFQIGQSKAVRNVVLNAVPAWLSNRAMDKAKGGVREKIEAAVAKYGMETVVAKALARLLEFGADETRVLAAMGRTLVGAITVEDLVVLQGSIAALDARADTVDAVFPPLNAAPPEQSRAAQVLGNIQRTPTTHPPTSPTSTTPTTSPPPNSGAGFGAEMAAAMDGAFKGQPPLYNEKAARKR